MTRQTSCQTCLSDLRAPPAFVPPCCNAPVCAACVAANPRLTSWVPCLRCGSSSPKKVKARVERTSGVKTTQVAGRQAPGKKREVEDDQFVLVGEDESDEEDGEWADGSRGEGSGDGDGNGEGEGAGDGEGNADAEPEPEIVEITHIPRRGETLLSIARQYATDPHTLLALNDLPHAALYANPRLVATRPKLVISRCLLNARTQESTDVTETAERRAQRALARFQAVAKAEEGVARAYLALHPPEAAAGSGFQRSLEGPGEVMFSYEEEVVEKKRIGAGEVGALEHYFEDEAWEAGAPRPARGKDGKWTVVGAVLPNGVVEKK